MAELYQLFPALTRGENIRRGEWDEAISIFLSRDMLMCRRGASQTWQYFLTWDEMTAQDWQLSSDADCVPPTKHPSSSHHRPRLLLRQ